MQQVIRGKDLKERDSNWVSIGFRGREIEDDTEYAIMRIWILPKNDIGQEFIAFKYGPDSNLVFLLNDDGKTIEKL